MRRPSLVVRSVVVGSVLAFGLALAAPPANAVGGWFTEYHGSAYNVGGTFTPVVGDFAGGGEQDIIWYAPGSGTEFLWTGTSDNVFTKTNLSKQVGGTYKPIVGNFGGDARSDIFWYGAGSASDFLWITTGSGVFTQTNQSVSGTYRPVVIPNSRYTAGALDEIEWYAPGAGTDTLWAFTGTVGGHTSHTLNVIGSPIAITGDFDGNNKGDVFWYQAGSGQDALWRGNGPGTFIQAGFSVNGTYNPVVEDFSPNADGRSDILWFRSGAPVPVWSGNADGSFTAENHTIGWSGMPIAGHYSWGYIYIWNTSTPDYVWYDQATPDPDYNELAGDTELGTGYMPIVGCFVTTGLDCDQSVFWYKAGSAPEYLMV
jgi:hypothetical protein